MENTKYLINGQYYEKDEILNNINLKNELEKQLKKEYHKKITRENLIKFMSILKNVISDSQ